MVKSLAMKRCLILLAALSLICATLARPAIVDGAGERLVLAFYYAWYDQATWQQALPDHPAQSYISSDPAAIERHVSQARRAGIDALVQSWYGPQVEGNQTETNFALLLASAAQYSIQAAVDLEVTSPFISSQAELVSALQHVLNVHANHPAYLRVGGKPVIFFWRQNRYSVDAWYAIRDQVDPGRNSIWIMEGTDLGFLGPFDGNHLYSVAWDAAPENVLIRWGQRVRDWNAQNGVARYWIATVMPGYDDRATGRSDAFVRDRAGGDYYRRSWSGASQSGADMVIITSFNEWMEGTQIEPSLGYGDLYLNLTLELGNSYRNSVVVPPTAAPTSLPPTPLPAPTSIPLPPPTPVPSLTPEPTATATPSPTPSPSPVPTATVTPSPSPAPTLTPVPTQTLSPTAVPVPTPAPTPLQRGISALQTYPGLIAGAAALVLLLVALARSRR